MMLVAGRKLQLEHSTPCDHVHFMSLTTWRVTARYDQPNDSARSPAAGVD